MTTKTKFLENLKTRKRLNKVVFLGTEMNVKVFSFNEMKDLELDKDDESAAKFLADQFIDIETGELMFTTEIILNDLSRIESIELSELFLKAQGISKEQDKVLEKN